MAWFFPWHDRRRGTSPWASLVACSLNAEVRAKFINELRAIQRFLGLLTLPPRHAGSLRVEASTIYYNLVNRRRTDSIYHRGKAGVELTRGSIVKVCIPDPTLV